MQILFIHPENQESYPIQIGALSAFLKRAGHQVGYLPLIVSDRIGPAHLAAVRERIAAVKPGLVAFSCYETSFAWICSIAECVKREFRIPTLIGGYYPTLVPEDAIACPHIDYVCRGEGEYPMLELCEGLEGKRDIAGIENLWLRVNGAVVRNQVRPLIEDLDSLPFPDRDIIDLQAQLDRGEIGDRNIKVIASRGCPYNCTYCSNIYFRRLYPNGNKYVRMRSAENVVRELVGLRERFRFDSVGFHDDNLTLFPDWLKRFSQLYREAVGLPFYCASRVERSTDETLSLLKAAGCYMLLFGVESGDEAFRKKHMKRFMTNGQIAAAFAAARRYGIRTWAFNMVGMPFERRTSAWKTIALNFRIRPSFAMTTIYYPLKGTDMGDACYRNGWVDLEKKGRVGTYAFDSILKHPHMSNLEIRLYKYLCIVTAFGSSVFMRALVSRALGVLGLKRTAKQPAAEPAA